MQLYEWSRERGKVFEISPKTLFLMLPLMCAAWEKKIYIYQKVNSKKKITSIKTQASESIFLHEFSIYIHFMLSKTIESAMLKFMALGKPDKIEDLTEPVAESG